MEKVSVIVVNWNVAESFSRCVKSVFDTEYPNLELVLIDNNSDKKPAIPEDKRIIYIQNSSNLGFPRGVNQGLRQARGDYILILNPDTRLPKDFFVKMINFCKSHLDAGVVGPKFTDPDGASQGSVFHEPSIFGSNQKYTPVNHEPTTVNAISGACLFFPRSTLAKVGLFTQEVFMYYEDLDYCRRIRRVGLKVIFHPQITIVHEHGRSTSQTPASQKYLWDASLWYNGPLKHYLMWLTSWSGQKFSKLFCNSHTTEYGS